MATTSHDVENGGEHSPSSSSSIVDPDKKLTDSIDKKLLASSTPKSSELSIYRVHKKFRKIDKFAYRPEMVSIGPFHHEERSLPKMDEHKLRYVDDFFKRTSTTTLDCVKSLRGMEDEARQYYSENSFGQDSDNDDQLVKKKKEKPKLTSDKFVKMMLFDGLFIIEVFRKSFAQKLKQESGISDSQEEEEEKNDLVFINIWRKRSSIRDMILLGNQLPMFVLDHLFKISTTTNIVNDSCSLTMLALHFFDPLLPRRREVLDKYSEYKGMHLLDLFKKTFHVQLDVTKLQPEGTSLANNSEGTFQVQLDEFKLLPEGTSLANNSEGTFQVQLDEFKLLPEGTSLANNSERTTDRGWLCFLLYNPCLMVSRFSMKLLPDKKKNSESTTTDQSKCNIPSVTELRVAGVRFDILESDSFLRIEFSNGVLKIPSVTIHDQMDSLMSNFIAAEQCYDGGANNCLYMTSYAFLMNSLLTSPKDVEFLRGQGIIKRSLNKDKDVSNLFTKLCTEVTLTNSYYSKLCKDVNVYYETHWKFWRASWLEAAKREFFNNPWTIFAFFAAVLVIILTLLQTIFTILSYYQACSTEAVGQNPKP